MWGEHTSDLQINDISQDETVKKISEIKRRKGIAQNLENGEEKEKFVFKISTIEKRGRIFS